MTSDQWTRDLAAKLDPGAVWKHGVLVAARREIERLRAEVERLGETCQWWADNRASWVEAALAAETRLALAADLAGLARHHAMHADVSKGDRARIAELCDALDGSDERRDARMRALLDKP